MKEQIIKALQLHFESQILKHKTNIDVMLENPMAIHDHTDLTGAIELELAIIAEYSDKLEVLNNYF